MSDNALIMTLAGQLGRALARVPLDSEQIEDCAAVLRILADTVRKDRVAADIEALAFDLDDVAKDCAAIEAEAFAEHDRLMRTSSRYRRADREGTL